MNNIIYIDLDVDDTNFIGCAVEHSTGSLFSLCPSGKTRLA
jgi:hypothetical protein